MRIHLIYFSPTGGTRKVCECMAQAFGPAQMEIDLTQPEGESRATCFDSTDLCLIGVPSYGGRVPALALERLKRLQGNQARALLVTTYGNRAYDNTLLELKNAANACGFRPIAAVAAATEHSILPRFGAGRPDTQDLEELRGFAQQLVARLRNGESFSAFDVPGQLPLGEYKRVPLRPKGNGNCTRCGRCASACPAGAIPKDTPAHTDDARCMACMRCVKNCPAKARKVSPLLLLGATLKLKKACANPKKNEFWISDSER